MINNRNYTIMYFSMKLLEYNVLKDSLRHSIVKQNFVNNMFLISKLEKNNGNS